MGHKVGRKSQNGLELTTLIVIGNSGSRFSTCSDRFLHIVISSLSKFFKESESVYEVSVGSPRFKFIFRPTVQDFFNCQFWWKWYFKERNFIFG
ncbi:unnamed protein product [Rhizophagus irregularis]|nr:unnamed protein product [Rhizophagus irregularis]